MRIQLANPIDVEGTEYTHVEASVAVSVVTDTAAASVRLVPCRQVDDTWVQAPPDAALSIVGLASMDENIAGFTAVIAEAVRALMVMKGI